MPGPQQLFKKVKLHPEVTVLRFPRVFSCIEQSYTKPVDPSLGHTGTWYWSLSLYSPLSQEFPFAVRKPPTKKYVDTGLGMSLSAAEVAMVEGMDTSVVLRLFGSCRCELDLFKKVPSLYLLGS